MDSEADGDVVDDAMYVAEEAPPAADPVVIAAGLGADGEHGPLFCGVDLVLPMGFHAIQMPGGPAQDVLLLTSLGVSRRLAAPYPCSGIPPRGRSAATARSQRSPILMTSMNR